MRKASFFFYLIAVGLFCNSTLADANNCVLTMMEKFLLTSGEDLTSSASRTRNQIIDSFSQWISNRLESLKPIEREKVISQINNMKVTSKGLFEISEHGIIDANGGVYWNGKKMTGFIMNPKFSKKSRVIFSLVHEIEHMTEFAPLEVSRWARMKSKLVAKNSIRLSEARAFGATYDFYHELKNSGLSFEDLSALQVEEEVPVGERASVMELIRKAHSSRSVLTDPSKSGLNDLLYLDLLDRNPYINKRLSAPSYH